MPHPRTGNDPELKVAGQNACRALFLARPDDIRRVYVTEDTLPHFKDLLKFCAQSRIAYHVKTDADLDQVAETVHHDGICLIAREQQEARPADVLAWARALHDDDAGVLVLLEGVKNPHNVGAILRVCAHFGVPFCLAVGETPALSPAAMRTAEGGAEHTRLVPVQDAMSLLQGLHRLGFAMLATSSHATMSLVRGDLPARAVVLFGSEGDGLSPGLLDVADATIAIPGSGALESLNVACASSVILWELWRARDDDARTQRPRPAPGRRAPRDDDHAAPRSPHAAPPIPPRASPPPRNAGPPATRSPRGGGDPGARERMSPRPR